MLLSILRSNRPRCAEDAGSVTVLMLAGAGGWRRRDVSSRATSPFRGGTIPVGNARGASSCSSATWALKSPVKTWVGGSGELVLLLEGVVEIFGACPVRAGIYSGNVYWV
jgi:hypothetical protein